MGEIVNMGPDDDAVVSYTVKELLRDIKGSVDQANGKLDAKADKTHVDQLAEKLDEHSVQIGELKQRQHDHEQWRIDVEKNGRNKAEWWKWAIGVVLTLLVVGVSVAQLYKMMHP